MLIIVLLLLLSISSTAHIYFLITYIRSHNERYLKKFINTAVTNVIIAGICIIIVIFKPRTINEMDSSTLAWLMSGTLMAAMLLLQVSIFNRVRRRARLPEYYHYNHFGKRVLNPSVVRSVEVVLFFLSVPFFLIAGAFFVARAIKYFF